MSQNPNVLYKTVKPLVFQEFMQYVCQRFRINLKYFS